MNRNFISDRPSDEKKDAGRRWENLGRVPHRPGWKDLAQRLQNADGQNVNRLIDIARGERFLNRLVRRFEVLSMEGAGPVNTGILSLKVGAGCREIREERGSHGDQDIPPGRMFRAA